MVGLWRRGGCFSFSSDPKIVILRLVKPQNRREEETNIGEKSTSLRCEGWGGNEGLLHCFCLWWFLH